MVTGLQRRRPSTILYHVEPLGPPTRPWRGWRNTDKQGSGVFWASRDGGTRHHPGCDALTLPGDDALAMLDGVVKRLIIAYEGANLGGVQVNGIGKWEGLYTVQLYCQPFVTKDQRVHLGQTLGSCQDVAAYYQSLGKDGMDNHLHMEAWQVRNVTELMARLPAPHVDS